MLIVISPAKRLDFGPPPRAVPASIPAFQADAARLAERARALDVDDLCRLMAISEKLALRARDQFRAFLPAPGPEDVKPAIFAFAGDTYAGLDARSLDMDALDWAQERLRILSGLYGLLRPFDAIQPYRLEMGSRLSNPRGRTLYDYWGDRLARALNEQARAVNTDILINCASVEYFTALPPDALTLRVITPVFKEMRDGEARIVSFYAKKARGAMARFIVENRITDPAGILDFDVGGYRYRPELSAPDKPLFLRDGEGDAA